MTALESPTPAAQAVGPVRVGQDRPIIFSAPMVLALLDGRKTQTRRVLKLPTKGQYVHPKMGGWAPTKNGGGGCFRFGRGGERIPVPETVGIWHQTTGYCMDAPYQVGDQLWVRETWKPHSTYAGMKPRDIPPTRIFYAADDAYAPSNTPWVSCIHMPRWASRLTLLVTDVRVERLNDISEADAVAEGALLPWFGSPGTAQDDTRTGQSEFEALWNSLHGPDAWAANPWVVAVTFTVHRANIDSLPSTTPQAETTEGGAQ